jgi:serine phosphatase RsbU (regulator of sigma subunit)/uncharacterized protein YigA (DUF484 family)
MAMDPGQRERPAPPRRRPGDGLAAFLAAGARVDTSATLDEALDAIAEAVAAGTSADAAVTRLLEPGGDALTARAVSAASPALAAELEGSNLPAGEVAAERAGDSDALPEGLRRVAARAGLAAVAQVPVVVDGRVVGSVETMRRQRPFEAAERGLVRLAATQVGLALRAFGLGALNGAGAESALELVGDALAAGAEEGAAEQVVRLAAQTSGARFCLLWQAGPGPDPELAAAYGLPDPAVDLGRPRAAAAEAAGESSALAVRRVDLEPLGETLLVTVRLGEPPVGLLQLVFTPESAPSEQDLAGLAAFGVRAAHTLRAHERGSRISVELERTRALLAVVAQAIAQLSLAHTLETAIARVAELLDVERVAVYLREGDRLEATAARGLGGPHLAIGERLLDVALGPLRGRGMLIVDDAATDRRLAPAAAAVAESGIEAVLAVPLLAHEEAIGLLAVYPPAGRPVSASESDLLSALAAQLAVAVQNARLHERSKRLGAQLEQALTAERKAARELAALYEISRSFAQTLSLETTLDAVARTVVDTLSVDAAAIAMLDDRREAFTMRAIHVSEPQEATPLRTLLSQPQPVDGVRPTMEPVLLDARTPVDESAAHRVLVPFLEKGATAAVVPVATPAELLATLTLLSLDPGRPLTREIVRAAHSLARQAALAIDNARLYQQQKDFADTMQRSLLPRTRPQVEGLEVGHVYESPARVDVGGDVYDFLQLDDHRLAVVLGDVAGHGIAATADMALAKFAFRSLAREHPEPGDFLASVNEVVVGETEPGKFITMTYVTLDLERGVVACANAGHPPPRLVSADGAVVPLAASGLALGIESGQAYPEVSERFDPGSTVVLYTDGLLEARRGDELYGVERLDRFLAEHRARPAQEVAAALLADCRSFADGELTDDCAVVVARRAA